MAIRKLPGVESVDVSLERSVADVRLKPGNTVTLGQLRTIVKDNGFSAREATVTATGSEVERGGKPAFNVSGLGVVWLIVPDPNRSAAYDDAVKRAASRQAEDSAEITGIVPAPSHADEPERIAVQQLAAGNE